MSGPVIRFNDVSKVYHLYAHILGFKRVLFNMGEALRSLRGSRFKALSGVSFEVKKGETVGIIGKNGSGKSTALALIAGVMRPTKGRVTTSGRVLSVLELGGGFHPDLTGEENIVLNGVLLGYTKNYVESKRDEIIAFSGIEEHIDQPLRTYSSGMLARLGFSVVANLEPDILLIDEVMAVGDKEFQKKCMDKMREFKTSGVTIVFVSHRMDEVEAICDRVLWIDGQGVRMDGPPEEVVPAYQSS